MNVLLTGGIGYIGSHTAAILPKLGYKVILYDNLSKSSVTAIDRLEQITGLRMPFVKGDVRDTDFLRNVLIVHKINSVIHFAGLKSIEESTKKPIEYYNNNIQGTISLLQAMHYAKVKSLTFSSSATVYGEPRYFPLDESHPTCPTNPYGRTKLYIEEILKDISSSDPNWRIACLRYFNPVGAHESCLIGENPSEAPNNLMPIIAQVATGQQQKLKVFGSDYPTPDGTGIRDYIHVMDLAEGHAATLGFLTKATGWHAINLGTGKGCSVLEIISAFERVAGCKIPYVMAKRRAGDVAVCYSNPKKATNLLNWKAKYDLKDMCESAWKFQQAIAFKNE